MPRPPESFINQEMPPRLLCNTHRMTSTSFLNAWICAVVGSLTFNFLIATGTCHDPLYTVPKEPDPILGPGWISFMRISQSSLESLRCDLWTFLLSDSADRARGRNFVVLVGDVCALCECDFVGLPPPGLLPPPTVIGGTRAPAK